MAKQLKNPIIGPGGMTAPKNVVPATDPAAPAPPQPIASNEAKAPAAAPAAVPAGPPWPDLQPVGWVGTIPTSEIEVGDIALRPAQVQSAEFKGLLASIEANGVFENLTVKHSDLTPNKYMLINGLQRLTICGMLGITEIHVKVLSADEAKQHVYQIQSNLHRVATKPAQFGASIRRMMEIDTDLTIVDIAGQLCTSVSYVSDRINLKSLLPEIAEQVDGGEITASAAIKLSKLPQDEQPNFVARAVSMPFEDFANQVETRATDLRAAKREARQAEPETFTATPRMRKKPELLLEAEKHLARAELVTGDMSGPAGFDLALAWVLQMDPASIEVEREKWEAEKKAREERAAARKEAQHLKKEAAASKAGGAVEAAVAAATAEA